VASHARVQADNTVLPFLHGLQSPAVDVVLHKNNEEFLTASATRITPSTDEVTYEYDKNHHSYWGISHNPNSGNPSIIMPLKIAKDNLGVSYASCRHDVVAIHIDTLQPKRNDWDESLAYLSQCYNRCIKRLESNPSYHIPKNNFELIIFKNFTDLTASIKRHSKTGGTLEDPIRRQARASTIMSGIPSELSTDGINLRSLHVLLPPGPSPQGALPEKLSSFFLSVMKADNEHVDIGEYSTRIDCYYSHQDHQSAFQITNFMNLVRNFLLSINIKPDLKEPFRDIARIGTIGKFFRQAPQLNLTNAFSSINRGNVLDDPLSPPPRGLRSFDEIYKPGPQPTPSAFYNWLNQYNWRLFFRPLHQGAPLDPDWTPRIFLEEDWKPAVIDFFKQLDSLSDKWGEHKDNWIRLQDPPIVQDTLTFFRKLLSALRDNGSLQEVIDELGNKNHHSEVVQLEFYSHTLNQFGEIWENLSAPYTHNMLKKKFPYMRSIHNIKYLDLQLLSLYQEVSELCELIEKFAPLSNNPAQNWVGYSQSYVIQRR
jgi:hypothetical protein